MRTPAAGVIAGDEAGALAGADGRGRAVPGGPRSPGPDPGPLRQGQQRRRRPRRRPATWPRPGYEVEALLLWPAEELSGDAAANLERFRCRAARGDLAARLAESGAVVDAIFGTGFAGAPREPAAAAIEAINRCGAPVVACDIASGVDASSGEVEGAAVEADDHRQLPRRQARAPGRPGQVAHRASCGWSPIGIPDGAPGEPAAGRSSAAVLGAGAARAGRARPSSAPAR